MVVFDDQEMARSEPSTAFVTDRRCWQVGCGARTISVYYDDAYEGLLCDACGTVYDPTMEVVGTSTECGGDVETTSMMRSSRLRNSGDDPIEAILLDNPFVTGSVRTSYEAYEQERVRQAEERMRAYDRETAILRQQERLNRVETREAESYEDVSSSAPMGPSD